MTPTTTLTRFDLLCLKTFDGKKFAIPKHEPTARTCAKLVKAGWMESDIVGGLVTYRTTDAGRAAIGAKP